MKLDFKLVAIWSALITAVSIGISMLLNKVSVPTANITLSTIDINVRQQLVSGLDPSIGAKIYSYLNGILPIGNNFAEGAILIFLTSFVIVTVGSYAVGLLNVNAGNAVKRGAWILTLGSVITSAALIGITPSLSLTYFGTLVTMVIYFAIVTFATVQLAKALSVRVPV